MKAYKKPEIEVLGRAAELIQGTKNKFAPDATPQHFIQIDCELED